MTSAIRSYLGVTLLAELGALVSQQGLMNRSMCTMAQAAVLGNRLVFPKIGAALFRMTLVTVVIQGQLLQHGRTS